MFAALATVFAVEAGVREPFDAHTVTKADGAVDGTSERPQKERSTVDLRVVGVAANGDDDTNAFVSTDEWGLGGNRPVTDSSVQISVAAS